MPPIPWDRLFKKRGVRSTCLPYCSSLSSGLQVYLCLVGLSVPGLIVIWAVSKALMAVAWIKLLLLGFEAG